MKSSVTTLFMLLLIFFSFTSNIWFEGSRSNIIESTHAFTMFQTPIFIDSDDDFENYEFPGDGSKTDPYLIKDLSITGNNAESAIEIRNTNLHFQIVNCEIKGRYGILLDNVNTATITQNKIRNSTMQGIQITGNGIVSIENNILINNGIQIINSNGNISLSNNVLQNSDLMMRSNIGKTNLIVSNHLFQSSLILFNIQNHIVSNNYLYQGEGLIFEGANNNTIENNSIIENLRGMSVDFNSSNNLIANNVILDTILNGMTISGDQNNISSNLVAGGDLSAFYVSETLGQVPELNNFTKNTVIDNTDPYAYDSGINNLFNETFWSNWSHKSDSDENGFFDESYPIAGLSLNYDYFPAVNAYHDIETARSNVIAIPPFGDSLKPQLNSPPDVTIRLNEKDRFTEWIAEDENPEWYNVTRDGSMVFGGVWYATHPIGLYFDEDYEIGEYIYEITVIDYFGNTNQDSVKLTVIESDGSSPSIESDTTIRRATTDVYIMVISLMLVRNIYYHKKSHGHN